MHQNRYKDFVVDAVQMASLYKGCLWGNSALPASQQAHLAHPGAIHLVCMYEITAGGSSGTKRSTGKEKQQQQ